MPSGSFCPVGPIVTLLVGTGSFSLNWVKTGGGQIHPGTNRCRRRGPWGPETKEGICFPIYRGTFRTGPKAGLSTKVPHIGWPEGTEGPKGPREFSPFVGTTQCGRGFSEVVCVKTGSIFPPWGENKGRRSLEFWCPIFWGKRGRRISRGGKRGAPK